MEQQKTFLDIEFYSNNTSAFKTLFFMSKNVLFPEKETLLKGEHKASTFPLLFY